MRVDVSSRVELTVRLRVCCCDVRVLTVDAILGHCGNVAIDLARLCARAYFDDGSRRKR